MSNITEGILLKAGFNDVTEYSNHVRYVRDNKVKDFNTKFKLCQ